MANLILPDEEDFKKWFEEAFQKFAVSIRSEINPNQLKEEPFLSRDQIAKEFGVSLVTINSWMKKGLPYHRLDRRIYFIKSEVMSVMSNNNFIKRQKK